MSKTIQEQIEVMQHFANGGKVEICKNGEWSDITNSDFKGWNFATFDFRIKEQKKTIIIKKWLVQFDDEEYRIMYSSDIDKTTASKIKLLETYEVEL